MLRLALLFACVAAAAALPPLNITDSGCLVSWGDCKSCVKRFDCAYCGAAVNPLYNGYCGPIQTSSLSVNIFKDPVMHNMCALSEIKYGQCYVSANLVVIIVPSVIGGLVVIIAIAICCCCRKRANRKHKEYMEKAQADEERQAVARQERSDGRRAERKAKADEIRLKYNL